MPGIRHRDDVILDAAKASILDLGINRTTLAEVARRCGVSRMTLYRRYADAHSLVREVLEREFSRLLWRYTGDHTTQPPIAGGVDGRSALVTDTLAVVRAFQEDPLLGRVLDSGPEVLVKYAIRKLGATQQEALSLLSVRIERGHRDGSIRSGSVAVQAHTILLVAQSYILSAASTRGVVPADRLLDELALLLDAYTRP
jgi:AcrR family transcriptional regulator